MFVSLHVYTHVIPYLHKYFNSCVFHAITVANHGCVPFAIFQGRQEDKMLSENRTWGFFCAGYLQGQAHLRSTHAMSLKCNCVAIGDVWMWMWLFIDDIVLMDGYRAFRSTHTHTLSLTKVLVQIRIGERWTMEV